MPRGTLASGKLAQSAHARHCSRCLSYSVCPVTVPATRDGSRARTVRSAHDAAPAHTTRRTRRRSSDVTDTRSHVDASDSHGTRSPPSAARPSLCSSWRHTCIDRTRTALPAPPRLLYAPLSQISSDTPRRDPGAAAPRYRALARVPGCAYAPRQDERRGVHGLDLCGGAQGLDHVQVVRDVAAQSVQGRACCVLSAMSYAPRCVLADADQAQGDTRRPTRI